MIKNSLHDDLGEQGFVKHGIEIVSVLFPTHSLPPLDAGGLLQARVLTWRRSPIPHVAEHSP